MGTVIASKPHTELFTMLRRALPFERDGRLVFQMTPSEVRKARAAADSLEEQFEVAQERLAAYENPGWINPVQKVMEYRQALRETWDDYVVALDDHASEEVRKEARHCMLRRFSAYEEQGWLSNPASRPSE